jgi:FtsZ-binding cell division protein ZapB
MKFKKILTSSLLIALTFSSVKTNAATPHNPPPPRVPGLDLIKPEPKVDGNRFGNVDLSSDLLAHYSFDGHANDSSGNAHHATTNGVTVTSNRFGHEGNAYAFDRDYVLTPDFSEILENELTVTGWLYRDDDSKAIEQVFEALTNVWEIFLETVNSKNGEVLQVNHSGNKRYRVHSEAIPNNEWFHFATVITDKEQSIYINGNLVQSIPHSGPLGIRTAFRIGRDYEGKIQYWDGAMDDFRIYSRGLNQYEVDDLFSDMSDMVDLKAGLVAHYPFSGNAQDQSGNNHHLTVNGAVLSTDRFGMDESSYLFDGKDDFLFTDIDDRKGDFSLSLWAKANDVEQSRFRSVINIHDKTPGNAATCQIHTSGGRYPTYQLFSSNPESFALVTTDWQHLTVTVSGKVIRFYENGKRVYSQELEGGAANKFSNIIIGRNRHGKAIYNGSIDDVYVYNRAINDAEVARLFDGGFEDTDGDGLTNDYETGKGRYLLVKGQYDWKAAKYDAELKGGHLATITSQKEWEAVKIWAGDLPSTYWLGGTDENTEGVWEWITKEAWSFTKWAKNEPNNLGNEDYLQTWGPSIDGNRAWNDNQFNENKNGYILEFGYYSNPNNADSDGDGYNDGKEVAANTDPNNPYSRPMPNILAPEQGPGAPPAPDYLETIAQKSEELRKQADELKQANEEIATKAMQIGELTSENAKLQGEVKSLNGKVTGLETEVATLKTDNKGFKGQIQNLREDNQNISYELTVSNDHLEEAIKVAETPFINGWVYDPVRGWIFTDAEHFPLVYTDNDQSWNYYELGSSAPRYFFNYSTQEWVAWDTVREEVEETVVANTNL